MGTLFGGGAKAGFGQALQRTAGYLGQLEMQKREITSAETKLKEQLENQREQQLRLQAHQASQRNISAMQQAYLDGHPVKDLYALYELGGGEQATGVPFPIMLQEAVGGANKMRSTVGAGEGLGAVPPVGAGEGKPLTAGAMPPTGETPVYKERTDWGMARAGIPKEGSAWAKEQAEAKARARAMRAEKVYKPESLLQEEQALSKQIRELQGDEKYIRDTRKENYTKRQGKLSKEQRIELNKEDRDLVAKQRANKIEFKKAIKQQVDFFYNMENRSKREGTPPPDLKNFPTATQEAIAKNSARWRYLTPVNKRWAQELARKLRGGKQIAPTKVKTSTFEKY